MASIKLIVMSDSHGDRAVVEAIKSHYQGQVAAIFHNGDSEIPSSDPVWEGIQVVAGNCDYDSGYPDQLLTEVGGVRVAQTHGHLQGINFGWDRLVYFALDSAADLCLYGHLHRAAAWQEEGVVFINPGSVLQPRGEVLERLYALVTIEDHHIHVAFYDLSHRLYPGLEKEFTR